MHVNVQLQMVLEHQQFDVSQLYFYVILCLSSFLNNIYVLKLILLVSEIWLLRRELIRFESFTHPLLKSK